MTLVGLLFGINGGNLGLRFLNFSQLQIMKQFSPSFQGGTDFQRRPAHSKKLSADFSPDIPLG